MERASFRLADNHCLSQEANRSAGEGLPHSHSNVAVRDTYLGTRGVYEMMERHLREAYGSARLHGRQTENGPGAESQTHAPTRSYLEDRSNLLELFAKFGSPFQDAEETRVRHLLSKEVFDDEVVTRMLAWEEIGAEAIRQHLTGGEMHARMKRVRIPGFGTKVRRVQGERVLHGCEDTFHSFIAWNAGLPDGERVDMAELMTYELGEFNEWHCLGLTNRPLFACCRS